MFGDIYGIVKKGGLINKINAGEPVGPFLVMSFSTMFLMSFIYGFAMGFGAGAETALQDGLKLMLIFGISYIIVLVPGLVTYRLVGGEEDVRILATIQMAGFWTASLILAAASPIMLFYGVIARNITQDFRLIQLVLINVSMILGFYMIVTAGRMVLKVPEQRLVIPLGVMICFTCLSAVLMVMFFKPFFISSEVFSYGWENVKSLWFH
jgi:hypothetical protein